MVLLGGQIQWCSGYTPESLLRDHSWETISDARNQTLVDHVQDKHLTCCFIISLALLICYHVLKEKKDGVFFLFICLLSLLSAKFKFSPNYKLNRIGIREVTQQ